MAADTTQIKLTASWQKVTDGNSVIAIQMANQAQMAVYIGDNEPTDASVGILIGTIANTPYAFSAGNLPKTADVYVKQMGTGEAYITVLRY